MSTSNKNCLICENKVENKNLKGTLFSWKDFPKVKLSYDYSASVCSSCHDFSLRGSQLQKLDELIEMSIRDQLSVFIDTIKEYSSLNQKKLARKIGITEVYLSELNAKKKTPSFQIFNFFKILAFDSKSFDCLENFEGSLDKNIQIVSFANTTRKFLYLSQEEIDAKNSEKFKNVLFGTSL